MRWIPVRLQFGLMVALVVVVAHDLALRIGQSTVEGGDLRATSHGPGWGLTAAVVLLAVTGLAIGAAWRMRSLRRRLLALRARVPALRRIRPSEALTASQNLFLVAVAAFVLQENLEHLAAHGHLPGLGVLAIGEYAPTLLSFAAVSLLVGALWTATRQRAAALAGLLAHAEQSTLRAPRIIGIPHDRAPDRRAINAQRSGPAARRAPPQALGV